MAAGWASVVVLSSVEGALGVKAASGRELEC